MTYLELQNALAALVGADEVSDLPESEQTLIQSVLNQTLAACYTPQDGSRPKWTLRNMAVSFDAPKTVSVDLTHGNREIYTSSGELDDRSGCRIEIDGRFYTLGLSTGDLPGSFLLEPFDKPTGTYQATLYHNAAQLPEKVVSVNGAPEMVGYGPLSPLVDAEQELTHRAVVTGDYFPERGVGRHDHNLHFEGHEIQTGAPRFFYIDESTYEEFEEPIPGVEETTYELHSVLPRFVVYPLPDAARTVRFRANITPRPMYRDSDTPFLPGGDGARDILLPMAMSRYADTTRRYNGNNREALRLYSGEAQMRLKSFSNYQKKRPSRMRMRPGY